jgi:cytochrome c5
MSNNLHEEATSNSDASSVAGNVVRIGGVVFAIAAVVVGALVTASVLLAPPDAENPNLAPQAVARRIQKIGVVEVRDNATRALRSAEEVFKGPCVVCHGSGALGAPKFGDKAAWTPRIATGYPALLLSALKGKNAMPPQGGGEYDDVEVARALVYMANAGGANFAEPPLPKPAASSPAATASK